MIGAQRAGKQWGVCSFSTQWGGRPYDEWTKQQDERLDWRQPEPVCCLKSLSLSACLCLSAWLAPSLCN